ncbi:TetR family transcriptional regulator [Herbidospora galbida]|uniref:TetR family transcriptional regulator n=1 Tax=Herbidospora galbida TaxID=2575442 RepID=A0A4U3M985_9ACTN|nr:TetR/AcrR family transcriptional regulator [Herbidospora galbida]TKK85618.1 TetR family transcriptional regulator [Herbidospora galbida]
MARGISRMRREDLLKVACEVIAAQGFGHTRTVDIAQAAGVSQALLFYHFETKEKLFAAAFGYAAERDLDNLEALLDSAGGPVDKLRAMLKLYSPSGKSKSWALWIDAWSESMRNPALEDVSRALDLRWKDALREILAAGADDGVFKCPDPEGAAWRLMSLIDGLTVQVTVHKRMLTRARLFELVRTAAAVELGLEPDQLA